MTLKLDLFEDFHVHGASAPEWNQRYLQISAGAMRSTLAEATADSIHVFRKWMSERVVQQGCLPAGKICFALPVGPLAERPWMQGRELDEDSLFVLCSGEEFTLQRPQGMELLALTFELEAFLRLLDERPWAPDARALLSRSVVRAPRGALRRLRHTLLGSFDCSSTAKPLADDTAPAASASGAAFEALAQLFDGAAQPRQSLGSASASYIVAQCHRIVAESGDAPPSVGALCQRLRTSRRSLQDSFRQVTGAAPVHYLRSVRLNAVRRQLMSTPASELGVARAAADHGFGHLSHFAERYKALFGELPSHTARGDGGRPANGAAGEPHRS